VAAKLGTTHWHFLMQDAASVEFVEAGLEGGPRHTSIPSKHPEQPHSFILEPLGRLKACC
jgi:hypothetical protein